jgi:glycosyltransferase involved in cell wall biosynthesis
VLHDAQITVVVPAYNEALHIGRTLHGIPAFVDRIVVVDDGSGDGTAAAVLGVGDPRVDLVRHPHNRGVGAALKTGYLRALAAGADVAVVMAGDDQMHPDDLRALLEPVLRGETDYAKGDRLSHPDVRRRMPRARLLGNRLLSALTRLATGLRIQDSQCGYTAITRRALERLPLSTLWDGYGYPNDLLGMLRAAGARVRDVMVRPVYASEQSGIGLRHALLVIPFVLLRVAARRLPAAIARVPSSLVAPFPAEPE